MDKKLSRIAVLSALILILLTGCSKNKAEPEYPAEEAAGYERGFTVSNNITPDEGKVLTCRAGYERNGSKKAFVQDMSGAAGFIVVKAGSDEEVFDGRIKYKKEASDDKGAVGVCDFSSVDKAGSYYIRIDNGRVSDVFTIEKNIYKRLLSDRLSDLNETGTVQGGSTKEDIGAVCLKITDYLMSQEFFPDSISPTVNGDARVMPRTALLAKAEIDALKEHIKEDGSLKAPFSSDAGCQYMYSAVFALFAYEYGEYDNKYSRECTDIAGTVYAKAEDIYEGSSDADKKAIDDKRYWACAQLYKLTGKAEYRETAESYVNDIPAGWNEEEFGYLGTMAYLTCYKRTDLDVSGQLITELMDDINTVVRESSKDDYLVSEEMIRPGTSENSDPEPAEIIDGKVFENARLAVLGNYISKNIKYVECAENYLAFLYGRNMLGKNYADVQSEDYCDEPQLFILAGLIDSYIYEDKEPEAMGR